MVGISILLLFFAITLAALSILMYIIATELETSQKEIRNLKLQQDEIRLALSNLTAYVFEIFPRKKEKK